MSRCANRDGQVPIPGGMGLASVLKIFPPPATPSDAASLFALHCCPGVSAACLRPCPHFAAPCCVLPRRPRGNPMRRRPSPACIGRIPGAVRGLPRRGSYLGFDRNNFPGAAALPALRKTFSFTGYWLNTPPSARSNTWTGKRRILRQYGFGFQVLFNGRRYGELQDGDPQSLGKSDARTAVAAVRREGFPYGTIIFIDQEEGGRLLAAQKAYIFAWAAAVNASGYRAGIYCSAMPATEQSGAQVVTAKDLYDNGGKYQLTFWVYNTASPPSPGCTFPHTHVPPSASGIPFASVWQFGQSPRPKDFAGQRGYAPDGQCYAPGLPRSQRIYIDVDSAISPDPSHGRGVPTRAPLTTGHPPR